MPSYIAVHQDGQARTDFLSLFYNCALLLSDTVKGNNYKATFILITYCHITRIIYDERVPIDDLPTYAVTT